MALVHEYLDLYLLFRMCRCLLAFCIPKFSSKCMFLGHLTTYHQRVLKIELQVYLTYQSDRESKQTSSMNIHEKRQVDSINATHRTGYVLTMIEQANDRALLYRF